METEQRLIDANALKESVMKEIRHYWNEGEGGYYLAEDVIPDIDLAPTVDAVEVVRCKKCAHCTVTSDGMVCDRALPTKRMEDYYIYGSTVLARVAPDDFCSYGERRTDGR